MSEPRVLLVEDDPDDVHFMKRAFAKVCPAVSLEVTMDGQAAVDRLSNLQGDLPSFVLLDLKIPKKSGLEVLEWIRSRSQLAALPVMILSSSQNAADVQRATALGIDAYHVKPVGYPTLLLLVGKICQHWDLANLPGKKDAT